MVKLGDKLRVKANVGVGLITGLFRGLGLGSGSGVAGFGSRGHSSKVRGWNRVGKASTRPKLVSYSVPLLCEFLCRVMIRDC